jgi:hypothetical protein
MEEFNEKGTKETGTDSVAPLPIIPAAIASPSIPLVARPVLHDEEYATELAASEPMRQFSKADGAEEPTNRVWGWSGMVVAILSLFILPVIMGSAGVLLGIIAFLKGDRVLGGWSFAISLVSIFTALILVPHYA